MATHVLVYTRNSVLRSSQSCGEMRSRCVRHDVRNDEAQNRRTCEKLRGYCPV